MGVKQRKYFKIAENGLLMVQVFIYGALLIFFIFATKKLTEEVSENCYKKKYKERGLSYYQHLVAIVTPYTYLDEANFGYNYATLLLRDLFYAASLLMFVLILGELGIIGKIL